MVEINGKFEKWLKAHGHSVGKIKNITHEYRIDYLNGMSCVEIVEYMKSLISAHGEDAVYGEHWTGYEDFYPVVEVTREETDEEYEKRIESLRKKHDRELYEKRKAVEDERKKIEDQLKALQKQLAELK